MSERSLRMQAEALAFMAKREPYLKELAGLKYYVLPGVYKGGTDTELLCSLLRIKRADSVWDIGTGAGIVALKAKQKGAARVLATDKNEAAVKNARKNGVFLSLDIEVKKADIFGNIKDKFDQIVFNPPFTDSLAKAEHHMSFWDKDHRAVRMFLRDLAGHLTARGRAMICWSSFGRVSVLRGLAAEHGYALQELGRRKGKNGFVYYVFEIRPR